MPKNNQLKRILIIGGGPVTIGNSKEQDCFGSIACSTLKKDGYDVIVVNTNPATVMTDIQSADKTYIEPLTIESITSIIELAKPDAILTTSGGYNAISLIYNMDSDGIVDRYSLKLLGADSKVIRKTQDRKIFKETMRAAGIDVLRSYSANSLEEGMQAIRDIGLPVIVKPSFTSGGIGIYTAYNIEEFVALLPMALSSSPVNHVIIEELAAGFKEIEIEVLRDSSEAAIVVADIENIDPTSLHSGDSAKVAPIKTLDIAKVEELKLLAKKVADAVGVVGSLSVKFAVDPKSGRTVVIIANPYLTRTSALAERIYNFPIAQTAVKLAMGYTLKELDLPEPKATCKYSVRLPRFGFERFPDADTTLNTSMQSIGVALGQGDSFIEALQKAYRAVDTGFTGLGADDLLEDDDIIESLIKPNENRLQYIKKAIENGVEPEEISRLTGYDIWFVKEISDAVEFEKQLKGKSLVNIPFEMLKEAKHLGYSDKQLAYLLETDEDQVRTRRKILGVKPDFQNTVNGKKVLILGSGPCRIGQGGEFDYCTVKASMAAQEEGFKSIIVNCDPSSISCLPEYSDSIYSEPLTVEDIIGIVEHEKCDGVITSFGGSSILALSNPLKKAGINVLGTDPENIIRARNRKELGKLAKKLNLFQSKSGSASDYAGAAKIVNEIGYPAIVRPENKLSGIAREIIYDAGDLRVFIEKLREVSTCAVLIERFIEDAIEVDIDAVSDGTETIICAVMEHIEHAGMHSGDSACSIPPFSLNPEMIDEIKRQSKLIASELKVKGLMKAHFAISNGQVYILGLNLHTSSAIPFISKASGVCWASVAAKVILGRSLQSLGITKEIEPKLFAVKESVFPFARLKNADVALGPRMKSTGEVMGINSNFGSAYIKAQIASGQILPNGGTVFVSVADRDKKYVAELGSKLIELGFDIVATRGTAKILREAGIQPRTIAKIGESRPDAIDLIKNGEIDLIINTRSGKKPRVHEVNIRSSIVARGIPIITTIAGAKATILGMETVKTMGTKPHALQEL